MKEEDNYKGEILEGVTLKEDCKYCGFKMGPTISYKLFTENKCTNKDCSGTFQGNCFFGYAWFEENKLEN